MNSDWENPYLAVLQFTSNETRQRFCCAFLAYLQLLAHEAFHFAVSMFRRMALFDADCGIPFPTLGNGLRHESAKSWV